MKNRTTEYRRHKRAAVIRRKKNIVRDIWLGGWNYTYDGCLSKGKIHCSCPMCRRKSYDLARQDDIRSADNMMDDLHDEGFFNSDAEKAIRHRVRRKQSMQVWRRPSINN